ncbi:MAG TPA: DUF2851 family protein [Flavobacteriales bacterium]|nr:DUF2851 family protein [Flavobacteriales bacterium]
MREAVLHYLWKFRKLKSQHFASVDGQHIEIIHPGTHNHHSGPDFLNAKINVNGIEWNGHVEIHVNSSEWVKHKHQFDAAYNNVILHIVYTCDQPVFTHSGIELVQVEIKDLVNENDLKNALSFIQNANEIPCLSQLSHVDPITIRSQKERALFNRLEARHKAIEMDLSNTRNNWEQVTFKMLAKAFGTNLNKHPFERLTEVLPLNIIQKEGYSPERTEAILFHYSGLLQGHKTAYAQELTEMSRQFVLKYPYESLNKAEWKFAAMRPYNFPTVRLAQLANLIYHERNLFSNMIEARSIPELVALLTCKASEYWDNHFNFNQPSPVTGIKQTSIDFVHSVIINAVIPILFAYSRYTQNMDMTERCVDLLEALPCEKNKLVGNYKKGGVECKSAFDSQALIELKNNFCSHKKCLTCSIGINLLKKEKSTTGVKSV